MFILMAQDAGVANGILQLFDRYGIATGMLVLFILATLYILRRLLNDKSGILTGYVKSTIDQQKHLADTVRAQSETDAKMTLLLESYDEKLGSIQHTTDRLEKAHFDPHSRFATVTLSRCFRHGCDILETIAKKLDIEEKCEPLIDVMRRELDIHNNTAEGGNGG